MAKNKALGMLWGETAELLEKNAMKEKQAKMLEKAVALAVKAHAGQRDKSGEPYVFHPLRMMLRSQTFEEKLVSVLHDVIEDSDYTLKELRQEGCPEDVLIAIEHLSRRNDESYDEFIERALSNALARKVKIKDLEDNMNLLRYGEIDEKISEKLAKYHRAWRRAQDAEQESNGECLPERRRFVL
jgi:hypothetical protein